MKMNVFIFTITIKKRKETLADAMNNQSLRHIQDTLIDKRLQYQSYK